MLKNGAETISVAANATSFAFTTLLPYNTAYAVTVQQQPTLQTCQVGSGSGMSGVTTAPIVVSCAGLQWTWLGGSSMPNAGSSYGSKGVAAADNVPGARAAAASWTDNSGALWIFGGYGNGASTGYLSDLWKYEPLKGLWTWMGGPATTNTAGVYGTQGVADPNNSPGGRNYSASWIDASGVVWIFGGTGYSSSAAATSFLNDLWKYDPASGNWTWVSGSNLGDANGVYGVKGTPAASNVPGAREGATHWVDATGALWLFGGYGHDSAGTLLNELNDLWKFYLGQWTWVNGDSTVGSAGVYGTKGNAAPGNHPGARRWSVSWQDSSGKLWLFGGDGYDSAGMFGALNDLWRYDPAINQWTWVNGENTVGSLGVYGTKGVANASNMPGARDEAVGWRDNAGFLWLYGGNGLGSAGARSSLNDLWKYDPGTTQWTWVSGSTMTDVAGTYGTRGVAASSNVPGARQLAATWVDANDTLWLFGGYGYDATGVTLRYLNDLWFVVPR